MVVLGEGLFLMSEVPLYSHVSDHTKPVNGRTLERGKSTLDAFSSYNKLYSAIYDSGSVPEWSIVSPRGTPPTNLESINVWKQCPPLLSVFALFVFSTGGKGAYVRAGL